MALQSLSRDQLHIAEAARVVEGDGDARLGPQDHVGMFGIIARGVDKAARRCVLHQKTPGHAEVTDQGLSRVEPRTQVFGAAVQLRDRGAGQPGGEPLGQGKAQVRPALLHRRQACAHQMRREAPPHRLDLRKFRHGRKMVTRSAGAQACLGSLPDRRP